MWGLRAMASGGDIVEAASCQSCEADGATVTAVGYCKNCQEYLCQMCYDGHLKPTLTRKHQLVGLDKLVHQQIKVINNLHVCPLHNDKPVEYHCPKHALIGCHLCFFRDHKECQGVKNIAEVAGDIRNTDVYRQFNDKLECIDARCSGMGPELTKCLTAVEESHIKALDVFKAFKRDIENELDRVEKEFADKADQFKEEESTRLKTLSNKVEDFSSEHQELMACARHLENEQKFGDLYTRMVDLLDRLSAMETATQETQNEIREKKLVCKPNMEILENLKKSFERGLLHVTGDTRRIQKLSHVRDINVKSDSDTATCTISGAVQVSKNKIVLTDHKNGKVKLLDTSLNSVKSELRLDGQGPFSVCKISDSQVAVATYENIVSVLNAVPSLSLEREISVGFRSQGVGYCDGKLLVSYESPHRVDIMDLQGTVLMAIEKDNQGNSLFSDPCHLCVDPDRQLVFASNYKSNDLLCLRLDGTVVGRYKDDGLRGPYQVTVDSAGTMYVCGRDSRNLHQVTSDCEKVRLLLTQADGLNCPRSICYDEKGERVYIGQEKNDYLKVYTVTCEFA